MSWPQEARQQRLGLHHRDCGHEQRSTLEALCGGSGTACWVGPRAIPPWSGGNTPARTSVLGESLVLWVEDGHPLHQHVLSAKAWEAWAQGKHGHIFHDLGSLVTPEQRKQVKALSITMQQIRQMPTGHMTLKNRFHDATKAATEVALSLRPLEEEALLKQQDEKYKRIAPLAIKRVQHILDNKDHFMHQARETGKTLRTQKQESKKQAFADLVETPQEGAHAWLLKGRAKQCQHCLKRLTLHAKLDDLRAAAQESIHSEDP